MDIIELKDIDFSSLEVLGNNKYDRVLDERNGQNHGRVTYTDGEKCYKIFHPDYIRRWNFQEALMKGFFKELAPALTHLISDDDGMMIGYVTVKGQVITTTAIPQDFVELYKKTAIEKNIVFYDFVPINIIKTPDGKISLIDLESCYNVQDLHIMNEEQGELKPYKLQTNLIKEIQRVNMKPISFIQPSRNNLKYLQWSYNSIRKNLGYVHEICWADDFSDDGTWEWMQEIKEKDPNVKIHRNEGPTRLGHTILYDTLVDMATNDIVMIYHADMYACPGLDEEINKYIKPGRVVSLTRIEPPLHPDGPEKILQDFGIEPEEFKEQELMTWLQGKKDDKITNGIFAPWAIYKDDFLKIGGHDPLFAPQSKEDSDIFNRFKLAGYEFIQTWNGFVYHMTCRGSRFKDGAKRNPDGQVFMKDRESDEWLIQNMRSTRNFIRKWGSMVNHDQLLHPIINPKYNIGLKITNCNMKLLTALEPWFSNIYLDDEKLIQEYIDKEQPQTHYDLGAKMLKYDSKCFNDVEVEADGNLINDSTFGNVIQNLNLIIKDSGEQDMEAVIDCLKIKIKRLDNQVDLLVNSVFK